MPPGSCSGPGSGALLLLDLPSKRTNWEGCLAPRMRLQMFVACDIAKCECDRDCGLLSLSHIANLF